MEHSASDSEIIADIQRVASELGISKLSRSQYVLHGKFSYYQIYDGGRTWEQLCTAAKIGTNKKETVPDRVYFERLQAAVQELGRLPKTSERKRFGLNFSKRRYPTLQAFIEEAVRRGIIAPTKAAVSKAQGTPKSPIAPPLTRPIELPTLAPQAKQTRPIPPIPMRTSRRKWERTAIDGSPYAPQDEGGVVALFAILCHQGIINWQILDLNTGKGIDATCYDDRNQKEIRVELKHVLSKANWNHSIEDIDYVICWDNRWSEFPKPVVELKSLVRTAKS